MVIIDGMENRGGGRDHGVVLCCVTLVGEKSTLMQGGVQIGSDCLTELCGVWCETDE